MRSIFLCISYVVPTIKVNTAEYKENKDILMMFQETKEWNLVEKSSVMLYRTHWIITNIKLQGRKIAFG